eukprot:359087-Chlamydomonas_euryale.AAC.3
MHTILPSACEPCTRAALHGSTVLIAGRRGRCQGQAGFLLGLSDDTAGLSGQASGCMCTYDLQTSRGACVSGRLGTGLCVWRVCGRA